MSTSPTSPSPTRASPTSAGWFGGIPWKSLSHVTPTNPLWWWWNSFRFRESSVPNGKNNVRTQYPTTTIDIRDQTWDMGHSWSSTVPPSSITFYPDTPRKDNMENESSVLTDGVTNPSSECFVFQQ